LEKKQIRLIEIQGQTECDIKFPYDENRHVKLMGTQESVDKARQILLERVQKLVRNQPRHCQDLPYTIFTIFLEKVDSECT